MAVSPSGKEVKVCVICAMIRPTVGCFMPPMFVYSLKRMTSFLGEMVLMVQLFFNLGGLMNCSLQLKHMTYSET
jgi:hypothetical protein